jgi:hypothetical protein
MGHSIEMERQPDAHPLPDSERTKIHPLFNLRIKGGEESGDQIAVCGIASTGAAVIVPIGTVDEILELAVFPDNTEMAIKTGGLQEVGLPSEIKSLDQVVPRVVDGDDFDIFFARDEGLIDSRIRLYPDGEQGEPAQDAYLKMIVNGLAHLHEAWVTKPGGEEQVLFSWVPASDDSEQYHLLIFGETGEGIRNPAGIEVSLSNARDYATRVARKAKSAAIELGMLPTVMREDITLEDRGLIAAFKRVLLERASSQLVDETTPLTEVFAQTNLMGQPAEVIRTYFSDLYQALFTKPDDKIQAPVKVVEKRPGVPEGIELEVAREPLADNAVVIQSTGPRAVISTSREADMICRFTEKEWIKIHTFSGDRHALRVVEPDQDMVAVVTESGRKFGVWTYPIRDEKHGFSWKRLIASNLEAGEIVLDVKHLQNLLGSKDDIYLYLTKRREKGAIRVYKSEKWDYRGIHLKQVAADHSIGFSPTSEMFLFPSGELIHFAVGGREVSYFAQMSTLQGRWRMSKHSVWSNKYNNEFKLGGISTASDTRTRDTLAVTDSKYLLHLQPAIWSLASRARVRFSQDKGQLHLAINRRGNEALVVQASSQIDDPNEVEFTFLDTDILLDRVKGEKSISQVREDPELVLASTTLGHLSPDILRAIKRKGEAVSIVDLIPDKNETDYLIIFKNGAVARIKKAYTY